MLTIAIPCESWSSRNLVATVSQGSCEGAAAKPPACRVGQQGKLKSIQAFEAIQTSEIHLPVSERRYPRKLGSRLLSARLCGLQAALPPLGEISPGNQKWPTGAECAQVAALLLCYNGIRKSERRLPWKAAPLTTCRGDRKGAGPEICHSWTFRGQCKSLPTALLSLLIEMMAMAGSSPLTSRDGEPKSLDAKKKSHHSETSRDFKTAVSNSMHIQLWHRGPLPFPMVLAGTAVLSQACPQKCVKVFCHFLIFQMLGGCLELLGR